MPAAEPAQRPVVFADLFSGIGGFHLGIRRALTGARARCAVTCEIDEGARRVYAANLLRGEEAAGAAAPTVVATDIRELSGAPYRGRLNLVCGGFPCQSYSSLGLRKGMRDQRGRLFNDLARFIGECQPRAFLLENVAGLLTSQKGAAFKKVSDTLSGLGYAISYAVLDSQHFGLPQHRKRVYIVGRRVTPGAAAPPFDFAPLLAKAAPNAERRPVVLRDILDPGPPPAELDCDIFAPGDLFAAPKVTRAGFVLRAQLSNFTNRKLFSTDGVCGTITTGSPPPIYDERYKKARHLSARELKRAQGFPAAYRFPTTDSAARATVSRSEVVHYVGNAVSVNVIAAIVAEMERQGLFM
jgi:site-specific DNA-cytosine methylase